MAMYQGGIAGVGNKLIFTAADRLKLLEGEQYILIDQPAPLVSRITLNRPEKHNCMNHELRAQLFNQLQLVFASFLSFKFIHSLENYIFFTLLFHGSNMLQLFHFTPCTM